MNEYLYRLKHRYVKHPELLETYGFSPYTSDEDDEITYAKGIRLPKDCSIVKYLIGAFEKCYKYANEKEKEEFSDYSFYKNGKVRKTKKLMDEFMRCQLCIVDRGIGKDCLFINAQGGNLMYYNTRELDECCGDLMNRLLKDKVIYKKKVAKKNDKN